MRKINLVVTGFILFVLSMNSNAQNTPDFFVGKWNILVTGTPNVDAVGTMMDQFDSKAERILNEGVSTVKVQTP